METEQLLQDFIMGNGFPSRAEVGAALFKSMLALSDGMVLLSDTPVEQPTLKFMGVEFTMNAELSENEIKPIN